MSLYTEVMRMRKIIEEKLREIEKAEDVGIIFCAESGSRAWGFASPDSDCDVRFVYVRRPEEYLRLEPVRDVIEWQLDETLDINGWDIQKALRLLYKSNPTIFEWDSSPIIYRQTAEWERLRGIMGGYFDPSVSARHYISLAKKNCDLCRAEGNIKLKKYLYCLRSLLACGYIVNRCAPPPVLFSELVRAELDPLLIRDIEDILHIKANAPETQYIAPPSALDDYIAARLKYLDKAVNALSAKDKDISALDNIFLEILKQNG